jgi:hypothetical protein
MVGTRVLNLRPDSVVDVSEGKCYYYVHVYLQVVFVPIFRHNHSKALARWTLSESSRGQVAALHVQMQAKPTCTRVMCSASTSYIACQ